MGKKAAKSSCSVAGEFASEISKEIDKEFKKPTAEEKTEKKKLKEEKQHAEAEKKRKAELTGPWTPEVREGSPRGLRGGRERVFFFL
jgi:hypothetical protein